MIATTSSGVNLVAKVTQTEWDLSSSITGTVKRRPTSLESCKSSSPIDKKEENVANIDFPNGTQANDDNGNAKDSTSCIIDKLNKSHDDNDDLSPEIEGGNVVRRKRVVDEVKKIDSPSLKKKLESARKSFSSKLKLPDSLSHLSPSRRSLPNKLSLSQLERQNNLFIRDGQQHSSSRTAVVHDNSKINKLGSNSKNNTIACVAMAEENAGGNNPPKSKKSLIPSFLSTASSGSGTKNNSNHIKIPSTSIKKAPNVVEKLTKTGSKFRELYREKQQQQTNLKRVPPPYRPPPTPSNPSSKQKKSRLTENVARNYEEIDVIVEENVQEIEGNNENISAVSTTTQAIVHNADNDSNIDNMLAKAEYSSNVFKNIPVRARKGGAVAHMENYCLFDPSVDFCNEKALMKKALTQTKIPIEMARNFPFSVENEEKIEDITFEDQTVYDITEHDERVAHHNYYEIDPELLEKEEAENATDKKLKMSNSSDSTSTSHSSANSSSTTTSSSDYPSLFNSVIETTQSSNVESTDDNDSNGYGKCQAPKINQQQNLSNESIITVQSVVTACDASTSNGAKAKKKAPQLDRIIRPGTSSATVGVGRNKQYPMTKTKLSKTNKISSQLDPLKQSHSLPQLQNVIVQNKCRQQGSDRSEINFVIDNTTTIQLRRPYSSRQQGRPLSTTSDDRDSGFLSPATPPDCAQNVIEGGGRIKDSTMLNQCDNIAIQQLIEVSH